MRYNIERELADFELSFRKWDINIVTKNIHFTDNDVDVVMYTDYLLLKKGYELQFAFDTHKITGCYEDEGGITVEIEGGYIDFK